ncbi:unnamed protein product [Fraxinus pennsylvanica]|uniref:Uncharacterized protein n=1 Tax=Fraxinus pennsylvanica TaxID=56036 RepID=A0AAD1ZAM2_9LAMI|nr:unnamed protein product [Fraxinus pennsylvanica]
MGRILRRPVAGNLFYDHASNQDILIFCSQSLKSKVQRDFEEFYSEAFRPLRDSLNPSHIYSVSLQFGILLFHRNSLACNHQELFYAKYISDDGCDASKRPLLQRVLCKCSVLWNGKIATQQMETTYGVSIQKLEETHVGELCCFR